MGAKGAGTARSSGTSTALGRPLLDTDAVAAALCVTPRHIQRLVSERRIPHVKVGRFVRFDPDELKSWLDGHKVPAERSTPREYVPWR
jgi:excisionase family DNA binding protein